MTVSIKSKLRIDWRMIRSGPPLNNAPFGTTITAFPLSGLSADKALLTKAQSPAERDKGPNLKRSSFDKSASTFTPNGGT